jgi:hypothetical protein
MLRLGALAAVIGIALVGLTGCPSPNSSQSMVSISGTLHAQGIGIITGNPVIELKQSGVTKYTLSASYTYDALNQILDGTLSAMSVAANTYDVVVTVDSTSNPYGSSCSITVNGIPVSITIDVTGSGPYVVTIPGIAVMADASIAIVLNNLS